MANTLSNLEPIEEGDVDLASKFGNKARSIETEKSAVTKPEVKLEAPVVPEKAVERKEGSAEKEASYAKILSKSPAQSPAASDEDVKKDAQSVSLEQDAESKVNNLIGLAQNKGLVHAVKVAKHFEDNYVLDEFHDRLLADELHDALVKKGIIKDL